MFTGYTGRAQELAVAGPLATWLAEKTIWFFSDSLLTCETRKVTNCYFLGRDKSSAGILVSILLSSR